MLISNLSIEINHNIRYYLLSFDYYLILGTCNIPRTVSLLATCFCFCFYLFLSLHCIEFSIPRAHYPPPTHCLPTLFQSSLPSFLISWFPWFAPIWHYRCLLGEANSSAILPTGYRVLNRVHNFSTPILPPLSPPASLPHSVTLRLSHLASRDSTSTSRNPPFYYPAAHTRYHNNLLASTPF